MKTLSLYARVLACVAGMVLAALSSVAADVTPSPGGLKPLTAVDGKIGIFDLKKIRTVPLDYELVNKRMEGNVVIEEFKITTSPGVRTYGFFTYPKGATKLSGTMDVRFRGAEPRIDDAKNGFFGLSVYPPCGNQDAKKKDTFGGPPFESPFTDEPAESWVYTYVVALIRTIDYIDTRPEANTKNLLVMGYSWGGYIVALLHALENRPAAYVVWHGTGYYADKDGQSGDKPSIFSRKMYEMYGPSYYAQYGSQPLYIGTALTDYFATLDGLIEMYTNLRCKKALAVAPNRYHASTSRDEFAGSSAWGWHWQGGGPEPATVKDGKVTVENGRLTYSFQVFASVVLTNAEVLYSYGAPGHWTGRTWHRASATKKGNLYACDIPVYDPNVPLYAVAQIESQKYGAAANTPMFIEPATLGITQASATYPHVLFDFEDKSDLYIADGTPTFITDAPEGKTAVAIKPIQDGTVHLLNIEPFLWKDAKKLRFFMKGDGKAGPIDLYITYDTNYWLDHQRKNYTKVTLVPDGTTAGTTWQEYTVSLEELEHPDSVDSLYFSLDSARTLMLDHIRWE